MEPIKIFVVPGCHSPLRNASLRARHGIELTSANEADCIIAGHMRKLLPYLVRHPWKQHLVYTNEPRCSRLVTKTHRPIPFFPKVEIVNVFTGDTYWHNLHYIGTYHFDAGCTLDIELDHILKPLTREDLKPAHPPVAAFFSYRVNRDTSYWINGTDRDLEKIRCRFALGLHRAGLCDIYGSDWPPGVSRESSGFMADPDAEIPWWTRKLETLTAYRYNLCLENTIADYYCTEKIWHAIKAGTLPIYWGKDSTLWEIFPRNSFIDLADFSDPEELIDFIQTIPDEEYIRRVNLCRAIYNEVLIKRRETIQEEPNRHMENIMLRLRR